MACLVEAGPGHPVSREDLLNRVWADAEVGDEALSVVVSRLRRNLRRAGIGGMVIRTVPKTGYMLADALPPAAVLPAVAGPDDIAHVPTRWMAGLAIVVASASLVLALAMSLAHNFSGSGLHTEPAAAEEPSPPDPAPDPDSWRH